MRAPVGWPTHKAKSRAQRHWRARMRRPGAWEALAAQQARRAERRRITRQEAPA